MVTAGIQGFKPKLSTQEGAELSIVQVCCAVPYSLQSPGQARAAAFCQLATCLLRLEKLPYFSDQGLKNRRKERKSKAL